MKKNYIQPATAAQTLQGLHIICGSVRGEIITSTDPVDPNTKEMF